MGERMREPSLTAAPKARSLTEGLPTTERVGIVDTCGVYLASHQVAFACTEEPRYTSRLAANLRLLLHSRWSTESSGAVLWHGDNA